MGKNYPFLRRKANLLIEQSDTAQDAQGAQRSPAIFFTPNAEFYKSRHLVYTFFVFIAGDGAASKFDARQTCGLVREPRSKPVGESARPKKKNLAQNLLIKLI